MNKELRELFDENHIITKKITLKNNIRIIDTGKNLFVIKKRDHKLNDLFKYLKSRGFDYFPEIIYQTKNYDVYKYINDVEIPKYERANDIIKLITLLHNRTTFYKEIDDNTYKELYENITNNLNYLYNYYDDMANIIEQEEYMSPSNYYFIRNINKVFNMISYAKQEIEKWYSIIEEKKRIRMVNIHNNLSLDHYLLSDKPYLISWHKSKKDLPIFDLINLYKKYYKEFDFCELLKNYEANYRLLPEERILFFALISIPDKIEFNDKELNLCKKINVFYNYINATNKLIYDYIPKEKTDKNNK